MDHISEMEFKIGMNNFTTELKAISKKGLWKYKSKQAELEQLEELEQLLDV